MRSNVALTVASAALLAACASAGSPSPTPATTTETVRVAGTGTALAVTTVKTARPGTGTLAAKIDDVWRVLPAVYESLGIPITQLDQAGRIVGNPEFRLRRQLGGVSLARYLDCGRAQTGPNAESYEITMAIATQVQAAAGGQTTVSTLVDASARPVSFTGTSTPCTTNGGLEERILSMIRDRL
jgi:hypothetical protein